MARGLILAAVAALAGCALGPPERMTPAPEIEPECAYQVEQLPGGAGLALEVVKLHRTFIPDAEGAVLAGRACFAGVASMLATQAGRRLQPLTAADMAATSQRDMGGAQTVHVTGKVLFAP